MNSGTKDPGSYWKFEEPTCGLHLGYLIGSLIYSWLNQKKELQWRL